MSSNANGTAARVYILLTALVSVLALASCGGLDSGGASTAFSAAVGQHASITQQSGKFTLTVLPESFAYGSPDGSFAIDTAEEGGATVLRISGSGLNDLRAFYAELSYPADELTPVSVEVQLGAEAAQSLSLARLNMPGKVELGAVLKHCDLERGVAGDAMLATLRFARHAMPARTVSAAAVLPPCMDDARPELGVNCSQVTVQWRHTLPGDYNQNGHVGIEDLTPLAVHWGDLPVDTEIGLIYPFDSIQDVIDFDNDLQIGLGDVTTIGAHMGVGYAVQIESFNIYRSKDPATDMPGKTGPHGWDSVSTLTPVGSLPFSAAVGDAAKERLRFSAELPDMQAGYAYWVRPVAGGIEGTPSSYANYEPLLPGDFVLTIEPSTMLVSGPADYSLDVVRRQSDIALEVWARNATNLQAFSLHIAFDPAKYNPSYGQAENVIPLATAGGNRLTTYVMYQGMIYGENEGSGGYSDIGFAGDLRIAHLIIGQAPQTGATTPRVANSAGPEYASGQLYGLNYDPVSQNLSWYYYNRGDCDQDGNVLFDDVIIIGSHFGESGSYGIDTVQFFIDANPVNDFVDISTFDLATIGTCIYSSIDKYNVYRATDIADVPVVETSFTGDPGVPVLGSVPFTAAVGDPMTQRLHFTYHVDNPQSGEYLWVQGAYGDEIGSAGKNCYVQVP